jgi:hypothetical protein
MSYCRFQNTSGDMRDCFNAINEAIEEGKTLKEFVKSLSSDEQYAYKHFVDQCRSVIELIETEE